MGLDQLRLLRSQHKMARLLLVGLVALCVASTKAAVIPMEELVDGLQSFLTAPEESGLRLKRSTGEWDKEFDLSSMGILFQLKYTNPANPFEGGRAHVKVPGARFVRNAPFDDLEMGIEFNGGSAIDGLFDMKVDYKFIQKFMFLADRPQEGSFVLYRKMEGGMWKTRVTVDNNNKMPKPFLDIAVESDRKTKLHMLFNFEEDNKWELKIDRVPGQKMTIEAVIDGQKWTGVGTLNQGEMKLNLKVDSEITGKHYTLDFDLNPAGMWGLHVTGDVNGPVDAKWTMQKDFTMGEVAVKYKNQNFAFMQLKGNAEKRGMFPVMFDYVVKYNIHDAQEHQGKAKMKFDGKTPSKKFEMSFAPKTGTPMDLVWNMDFSSGFKYDYDFKVNSVTMEKGDGEYKWVNNAQKFELITKDTYIVSKQSPFHTLNTWITRGREWTKMEHTRNFFFDKVNKAHMINKMKMEEHNILDGKTWYHIKYDNTAPRTAFLFTFLPYNMDTAWTMKITSAGPTKTFWFNGEEKATVDFDSSSKKASHTMHLPSGKDLTIDLAWPKMTADASDLEFGVTITPDRKVVTKFGWEWAGVKKVYLDVVGNNPWIGDYKLSRQGEFEEVSGSLYKIKWTGHGETTKGFLSRASPVETNVVASVNTRNLNVDAIVWKSFAGQKYGFTLNNDKFMLLAGRH